MHTHDTMASMQTHKHMQRTYACTHTHKLLTSSTCCFKDRRCISSDRFATRWPPGVPISSSASSPRNILSSKSPTLKTYSSYALLMAFLWDKSIILLTDFLWGQIEHKTTQCDNGWQWSWICHHDTDKQRTLLSFTTMTMNLQNCDVHWHTAMTVTTT